MHTMIIELQLLSHLNNALKGLLLKGLMFESETNGFVDDLILSQYSFSFTHTLIFSIRKVVTTNDIHFFFRHTKQLAFASVISLYKNRTINDVYETRRGSLMTHSLLSAASPRPTTG